MMYQVKMQLKEMVDRCPVLNLKAFLVRGERWMKIMNMKMCHCFLEAVKKAHVKRKMPI